MSSSEFENNFQATKSLRQNKGQVVRKMKRNLKKNNTNYFIRNSNFQQKQANTVCLRV